MSDLYERLAARLGPKGWAADAATLAPYLCEWRGKHHGASPFLAMPASTEEVADLVRLAAEAGAAITPQGGNTGLVGGQIPDGEILVSLKRMNRIRSVDAVDDALTAEAGVVLAHVQEAAEQVGRLFPLSLGSEGAATVGGLVSTNAGGVHVVRYGMMRDLVLGLEAVLADGRVWNGLSALRKDNTGYDLKQAFIGAEGTLGVVTAACLKLFPRPTQRVVALARVAAPERALALLHRAKAATGALSAFELMNRLSVALAAKNVGGVRDPMPEAAFMALIEFEAQGEAGLREAVEALLGAALEAGEAEDVLIAQARAQERAFWTVRESIAAGHRNEGAQVNHDVSVPVSRVPEFLMRADRAALGAAPGARIVAFGHIGDGNIHYSVLESAPGAGDFPAEAVGEAVNETAAALGGSISAEHGVGVARRADLRRYKSPESIAMMRAIKAALDPNGVMNPRVMLS